MIKNRLLMKNTSDIGDYWLDLQKDFEMFQTLIHDAKEGLEEITDPSKVVINLFDCVTFILKGRKPCLAKRDPIMEGNVECWCVSLYP